MLGGRGAPACAPATENGLFHPKRIDMRFVMMGEHIGSPLLCGRENQKDGLKKLFQNSGAKNTSRGYSSNLPASISKIITYFERVEKWEKLSVGPAFPKPGPMLFKVAAIAVKVV